MSPAFAVWQFALAGLLCAAIPLLIHLLSRRRFRVVKWAAMQLLREADQRSQRVLRLRDALLLLLRTAAIILFGMALARPYFPSPGEQLAPDQAVHAILLIDNSLSMGYQSLSGTRLDQARFRAAALIEQLPDASRISVVPLAGAVSRMFDPRPHDARLSALDAVRRIEVVDRSASMRQAMNEARRAADSSPELPPRYVLFSDQQWINWRDWSPSMDQALLPHLRLVDLSAEPADNTWVADLRIQDGIADAETQVTIVAEIRHRGREPRGDLRVALSVQGEEVDGRIVRLPTANASREVSFEYNFRAFQPEGPLPVFVPIAVSLSPDRLPGDDERNLMVPVVAALPVVFVDQYGRDGENPALNRLGETRHLRQLLVPPTSSGAAGRRLVQVRHVRIDQLDRGVLADARLTVVAGVASPEDKVDLLREYVEQGGQLVVAAGAEFDAAAWNSAAWRGGTGILPLPLLPELLGTLPEVSSSDPEPWQLSFESLGQHPYFQLAGNTEQELRDLYAEPFFFQLVAVDSSPAVALALRETTRGQIELESAPLAAGVPSHEHAFSASRDTWLRWAAGDDPDSSPGPAIDDSAQEQRIESRIDAWQPLVLARFTSPAGPAFLVSRRIGRGNVLLVTSGLLSSWNTLPKTNAIVIFDRILRGMIETTIPPRNFAPVERIAVPIPAALRDTRILLNRPPGGADEPLETRFLEPDQPGVVIERPLTRGVYRIRVADDEHEPDGTRTFPRWQFDAAVNGAADESNLETVDRAAIEHSASLGGWQWVAADETAQLAGGGVRGQDLWWWLAFTVLLLALLEMAVLIAPGMTVRTGSPRTRQFGRLDSGTDRSLGA